jgi:AraC family transcriptional regulator of adaptative response/methylated-DNA-[protein]-cysteine methyltransferase
LERVKRHLRDGEDVTTALYRAGYGSPSRLYERADDRLGMTPDAYRRGGAGMRIAFDVVASPLGLLLVAATERGLCSVRFDDDEAALTASLAAEFPTARIERDAAAARPWVAQVLGHLDGREGAVDGPLDAAGTDFQRLVWETLRAIPAGETRTYGEVARAIGRPTAARAVARACAENPVALIVPCHRVVRGDGGLGGYRWGLERKRALLDRERRGPAARSG